MRSGVVKDAVETNGGWIYHRIRRNELFIKTKIASSSFLLDPPNRIFMMLSTIDWMAFRIAVRALLKGCNTVIVHRCPIDLGPIFFNPRNDDQLSFRRKYPTRRPPRRFR